MEFSRLTKIDENRLVVINSLGLATQYFYETYEDALYALMRNFCKEQANILIEKESDTLSYITVQNKNDKKPSYYELQSIKPLSFRNTNH